MIDSTIRLKQINQPELSGFVVPIIQALFVNTGSLTGIFYPLSQNPQNYVKSGDFISQVDLDSAIYQSLSYVASQYATENELLNTGEYLLGLINASSAGVSSLNSLSGALSLTGKGNVSVIQQGQGFVISGDTGIYASFVTTGQTGSFGGSGSFYPLNANPARYLSSFNESSVPFIANGSIVIMPGYDILTDAAGSPIIDAAGNYITQQTTGNLGINQFNPQYTMDVDGSGNFSSGIYWNGNPVVTGGPYLANSTGVIAISGNVSTSLRTVSGAFSILTGNSIILVNTLAAGNTGTFPNASGLVGTQFVVKDWKGNATGNNIIITGINNQTFDGSLSKTISLSYDVLTVVSDGQNWCII